MRFYHGGVEGRPSLCTELRTELVPGIVSVRLQTMMQRASPPDESRVDTQPHHKELQTSLKMSGKWLLIQRGAGQTPLPHLQLGPLGAESRKPTLDPDSPLPSKGSWWLTRAIRVAASGYSSQDHRLNHSFQFSEKYLSQTFFPPAFCF